MVVKTNFLSTRRLVATGRVATAPEQEQWLSPPRHSTTVNNRINNWLTRAANLSVIVGIILLVAKLQQNHELAKAAIRNDLMRYPGSDIYMEGEPT